MIWFTSDTHFFHRNVIEYCNRPWHTVEEMNEGLIERWNARVKKNERIYVLGDFCFGGAKRSKEILDRLNGHKILILGNHDGPAHKMLAAGFAEVYENHRITLPNGQSVLLSHFPYHPHTLGEEDYWRIYKHDTRYLHKRIVDDGESILLHGHVHTQWKCQGRQINVGADVWDWAPVSHEQIQNLIVQGIVARGLDDSKHGRVSFFDPADEDVK